MLTRDRRSGSGGIHARQRRSRGVVIALGEREGGGYTGLRSGLYSFMLIRETTMTAGPGENCANLRSVTWTSNETISPTPETRDAFQAERGLRPKKGRR